MSDKPRPTYAELLNWLGSIMIGERQYLFEFLNDKANEASALDGQIIWERFAPRYETASYLAKRLAAALRDNGGEFSKAAEISVADVGVIWEALTKLDEDEEDQV